MRTILWLIQWLLRAAIFFVLFAFALNNPHLVQINWFFGQYWQSPLVLVVLLAFAAGVVLGAIAMAPHWWRQRQRARSAAHVVSTAQALHVNPASSSLPASS